MRKNILFTLFGIVCLMMPVGANAEECSYATDHLWPSDKLAPVLGQNMIVCSDKKIFYCDGERKGKIFYGNVKQNIPSGSFNVTSSDETSLLRCDGKNWQSVTQDDRSCCDDCSLIEFEDNTCNCSVYISDQYGWSLNKCGSNVPDIPSNWEYKECCNKISPTDYAKNGKSVYRCDEPGDYWTYEQCESMEDCSDSICTDATTSGTLTTLPWNATMTTQVIRENIVYYDDACSQRSYYKCSQDDNYQKYIWAHIKKKSNNFPWVITKGTKNTLLFCDGSEWKKLEKKETLQDPNCFHILNKCGVFYTDGENWSNKACNNPFVPEDRNNDGNSECTGCCQDMPLHSNVQMSMDVLNNFVANADVSVWVTKDGKFNYARLGTDVASGAVMGTVGGLVSNAIIKKNQLEKGMEGYYCTVGSDSVADYGDEFIIGF